MHQESIYDDCPTPINTMLYKERDELKITGSRIKSYVHFKTDLSDGHQIQVLLSDEESEKIVNILNEAAKRTAGAIYAASKDLGD